MFSKIGEIAGEVAWINMYWEWDTPSKENTQNILVQYLLQYSYTRIFKASITNTVNNTHYIIVNTVVGFPC